MRVLVGGRSLALLVARHHRSRWVPSQLMTTTTNLAFLPSLGNALPLTRFRCAHLSGSCSHTAGCSLPCIINYTLQGLEESFLRGHRGILDGMVKVSDAIAAKAVQSGSGAVCAKVGGLGGDSGGLGRALGG